MKILHVDNVSKEDNEDSGARSLSAQILKTFIKTFNGTAFQGSINASPMSFAEREAASLRAKEEAARKHAEQLAALERKRQEDVRRQAEELVWKGGKGMGMGRGRRRWGSSKILIYTICHHIQARRQREMDELRRRQQEELDRQRRELEAQIAANKAALANLREAADTGGAVKEYEVYSTTTRQYFKLVGCGSLSVSGSALALYGNWQLWQQGMFYYGKWCVLVLIYCVGSTFGIGNRISGDVQDLNIRGNITINSSITVRNLNVG